MEPIEIRYRHMDKKINILVVASTIIRPKYLISNTNRKIGLSRNQNTNTNLRLLQPNYFLVTPLNCHYHNNQKIEKKELFNILHSWTYTILISQVVNRLYRHYLSNPWNTIERRIKWMILQRKEKKTSRATIWKQIRIWNIIRIWNVIRIWNIIACCVEYISISL